MLYNEYRPLDFSQVVGQDNNLTTLKRQTAKGSFGQSYLFAGYRGTGKTTIARILARAVNCSHPTEDGPCNECESCVSVLNNEALDFIELDAASNNGVDQIKELVSTTTYLPTRLKKKVYVIDEVHNLSSSAFDSLLKTIEEPPEHCVFILCTTELHKIPATIQSRCEIYTFPVIPMEVIVERLRYVLSDKRADFDEGALGLVAKHSNGALRDALSILEKLLDTIDGRITVEAVKDHLSLIDDEVTLGILYDVIRKNTSDACKRLDKVVAEGKSLQTLTDNLLSALSDMVVLNTTRNKSSLLNGDSYAETLEYTLKHTCLEEVFYLIDQFSALRGTIRNSLNPFMDVQLCIIKTSCPSLVKGDVSSLSIELARQKAEIQELKEKVLSLATQPHPPIERASDAARQTTQELEEEEAKTEELKEDGEWKSVGEEVPFADELPVAEAENAGEGGEGQIEAKEQTDLETPKNPFLNLLGIA